MANEPIWIAIFLFSFFALWAMRRLFGVMGLYVWIALAIVVANVTVVMTITLFGLTATLGNVYFGSIFAVTDSLYELHGRRAAYRAVWIGLCAQVSFTILIFLTLLLAPAPNDFAYPHLSALFRLLPRLTAASLIAYTLSQSYDVWIFQKIRSRWPRRQALWIRNNLSTLSSQLIDTVVFCAIAFYGVFALSTLIEIAITTYLFKAGIAIFDTPFVYILTRPGGPTGERG